MSVAADQHLGDLVGAGRLEPHLVDAEPGPAAVATPFAAGMPAMPGVAVDGGEADPYDGRAEDASAATAG